MDGKQTASIVISVLSLAVIVTVLIVLLLKKTQCPACPELPGPAPTPAPTTNTLPSDTKYQNFNNVDCGGNDIIVGGMSNTRAQDCLNKCNSTQGCVGYTISPDKKCWLKSNIGLCVPITNGSRSTAVNKSYLSNSSSNITSLSSESQ